MLLATLHFALVHACRDLSLVQFLVACVDPAGDAAPRAPSLGLSSLGPSSSASASSRWAMLPPVCQRVLVRRCDVLLRSLPSTRFIQLVEVVAGRAERSGDWLLLSELLLGLRDCVRVDDTSGVVLEVRVVCLLRAGAVVPTVLSTFRQRAMWAHRSQCVVICRRGCVNCPVRPFVVPTEHTECEDGAV